MPYKSQNNFLATVSLKAKAEAEATFMEVLVGEKTYQINKVSSGELHLVDGKAYFMYRMLSETQVAQGSRHHSDFSEISLADYVDLAKGVPFLLDHNDYASDNAIGRVVDAYYSNGIDGSNVKGINGIIEIDTEITDRQGLKYALQVATKIKRGYIYSGSVQLAFAFKRSHADIDNFRAKVGSKIGEEYVRKIATGISKFYEFSGLSHGADPNAKLLNNTEESYIAGLRKKFNEKETFNTVLIPDYAVASFGDNVFNDDAQVTIDALNADLLALKTNHTLAVTALNNTVDGLKLKVTDSTTANSTHTNIVRPIDR